MKLYNTLTKKIEDFIPWHEDIVTFYTCGPTVYNFAHIGNLRNYIGHDLLERTLRYLGFNVKRVMNITDIGHLTSDADFGDDKMVKMARQEKKSVMDIANFYTEAFFKDFKLLNNIVPEVISSATDNIEEYIKIIENLIEKDIAYFSGGNVYLDTSKVDNYYALTNHKEDELKVGVRDTVISDENKRNQADFVLWFTKSKFDSQELKWMSPWGLGYPGWHIECSGICLKFFGEYLDIHGGGVDNIFPHHTNEIAQSEAFLGHKWCKYWFHNEHLIDEGGKISKSKGTMLTINLLIEKGYDPLSYRYMCLQSHYRHQLTFSFSSLDSATNAYKKLLNKTLSLEKSDNYNLEIFNEWDYKFKGIISDDLNIANALTLLYELLKSDVDDATKYNLIKNWDRVFGLNLVEEIKIDEELEHYILDMIDKRNLAKKDKNYKLADKIRDELQSKGIILEDTKDGTNYKLEK